MLFLAITFFSFNVLNVNSLECVSMKNQECKTRTKLIGINNNNEPVFYPFSIKVNKCGGGCNNINDTYANCVFQMLLNTKMSKYLIFDQEPMKQGVQNGIKLVNANLD